MNYLNLFYYILSNPIYPNLICQSVKDIPYQNLKKIGIKCLIFDRDNTLTKHLETTTQYSELLKQLQTEFDQVLLVSNSKINEQTQLGLCVAQTVSKKPLNYDEIKQKYLNNIQSHQVCVIGDRLMTDMVLAHKNGLVGVLVKPIDTGNEEIGIKIMRFIENIIMRNNQIQRHPYHGYLNF